MKSVDSHCQSITKRKYDNRRKQNLGTNGCWPETEVNCLCLLIKVKRIKQKLVEFLENLLMKIEWKITAAERIRWKIWSEITGNCRLKMSMLESNKNNWQKQKRECKTGFGTGKRERLKSIEFIGNRRIPERQKIETKLKSRSMYEEFDKNKSGLFHNLKSNSAKPICRLYHFVRLFTIIEILF